MMVTEEGTEGEEGERGRGGYIHGIPVVRIAIILRPLDAYLQLGAPYYVVIRTQCRNQGLQERSWGKKIYTSVLRSHPVEGQTTLQN